jgi:hypothetical protein
MRKTARKAPARSTKKPIRKPRSPSRARSASPAAGAKATGIAAATGTMNVAKAARSIASLGRELAYIAYQAAVLSWDYSYYSDPDHGYELSDLWDDYWDKNYKYIFFAAVYALDKVVRGHSTIRAAIRTARSDFFDVLQCESKACFKSMKEHKKQDTDERLRGLTFFNGLTDLPLPAPSSYEAIEKQLRRDRWYSAG